MPWEQRSLAAELAQALEPEEGDSRHPRGALPRIKPLVESEDLRGRIEGGISGEYQVTLKVGFRLESRLLPGGNAAQLLLAELDESFPAWVMWAPR